MYIPDWSFVKELKRHDKKLDVVWSQKRKRWCIVRYVPSPGRLYEVPAHICVVQNEDGSFRPLDSRTIHLLRKYDHHQRGAKTVIDEMIEEQERALDREEAYQSAEDEYFVKHEIMPAASKDADNLGSINIPKEDLEKLGDGYQTTRSGFKHVAN